MFSTVIAANQPKRDQPVFWPSGEVKCCTARMKKIGNYSAHFSFLYVIPEKAGI